MIVQIYTLIKVQIIIIVRILINLIRIARFRILSAYKIISLEQVT